MKRLFKTLIGKILIGVLIAAFLIWRIASVQKTGEKIIESGKSRVKVAPLQLRDVRKTLEYNGSIKGIKEVLIFPEVPGILRKKVKTTGNRVKKDDVILLIDRDEAALEYSMSRVESPINGRVLEIMQDVGSRVSPSQPVARVGELSRVEIKVEILPEELNLIKVGQIAEIKADGVPDQIFTGKVHEVGAALEMLSRKIPVKILTDNPQDLLKSGMVCNVVITVKTIKSVKAVPSFAIIHRGKENGVFIINDGNVSHWVETEIILEGEKNIAIEGNLKVGDKVVVDGNYGLLSGREVEILE